jgi:hypothetical protein
VLGQCAWRLGLGLWLRLGLGLSHDVRRRGGCLDDRPASTGLRYWLWDCLHILASGDGHATSHNRGGGDAETSASDEIAACNYRSYVFLSGFRADGLGRLLACRAVVFRHQTSPFPELLAPG